MVQTTFSCRYAAIHLVYHPFYTSAEKSFDEGGTFLRMGCIRTRGSVHPLVRKRGAYEIVFGGFYV